MTPWVCSGLRDITTIDQGTHMKNGVSICWSGGITAVVAGTPASTSEDFGLPVHLRQDSAGAAGSADGHHPLVTIGILRSLCWNAARHLRANVY